MTSYKPIPRLNGVIRTLESREPAFLSWAAPEISIAQILGDSDFDGVVIDLEHNAYDIRALRECLVHMLNRRRIAVSGIVAPSVTPIVRIPSNGIEMNQWVVKQVLDSGAYGILFPHVNTVEQALSAVAACRYRRPHTSTLFRPAGTRGDGPKYAATYWGLTQQEYYERADVWPLNPQGEIIVGIMCESMQGVQGLAEILTDVPGIGMVMIGEGDLSQDLGFPRQYQHPAVLAAMQQVLDVCKSFDVPCAHPHVDMNNVKSLLNEGYRILMPTPSFSFDALQEGRRLRSQPGSTHKTAVGIRFGLESVDESRNRE